MRLDQFLVKNRLVKSRMKAKRAIKRGLVKVNRKIVLEPSYDVRDGSLVEIDERANMPEGYWKLSEVEKVLRSRIVKEGDRVLDVGSSAGGFVYFCLMRGAKYVVGLEYSKKFSRQLKRIEDSYTTFSFIMANAFYFPLKELSKSFDIVLVDLTVEPEDTLKILEYLGSERVKNIFLSIKIGKRRDVDTLEREIRERCEKYGYSIVNIIKLEKSEFHVILKRKM
ncbi:MAG: S4 domain-containing protein [Candidatus Asgardarchaeia archaeon]